MLLLPLKSISTDLFVLLEKNTKGSAFISIVYNTSSLSPTNNFTRSLPWAVESGSRNQEQFYVIVASSVKLPFIVFDLENLDVDLAKKLKNQLLLKLGSRELLENTSKMFSVTYFPKGVFPGGSLWTCAKQSEYGKSECIPI